MAAIYGQGLGACIGRCIDGWKYGFKFAFAQNISKQARKEAGLEMGYRWDGRAEYISDFMVLILGGVSLARRIYQGIITSNSIIDYLSTVNGLGLLKYF